MSEECGEVAAGDRRWILDPIDGTMFFVDGDDAWGTHVALEVDGEIVLGVITRPLQERRWWAARGHGAFVDSDASPYGRSTRLAVSGTGDLSAARVGLYAAGGSSVPEKLNGFAAGVVSRGSHILELVEGRLDAIVSERCGYVWDHAPAVVLTVEAGGEFTDPAGGCRADLQGGIYTNGLLHDELASSLRSVGIDIDGSRASDSLG